jgi:hypothetical protein
MRCRGCLDVTFDKAPFASRWDFPDGVGVGGVQNLGEGGGVVDVGEGGVGEVSVIGVDGLGGGGVSVDGRGREGGSDEASMTSDILGGREDDLLGSEARRGGRSD